MGVDKMSFKNLHKFPISNSNAAGFKAVLDQKRAVLKDTQVMKAQKKVEYAGINHAISDMVKNHEMAQKTIKTFMNQKDHSLEKVLAIQYQAGKLFFHEQMFSKTVEVSANALKTFTQMQV